MKSSGQSQNLTGYVMVDLKQMKDENFLVLVIKYELGIIFT